ncbi:MAG: FkbM family methyltransferase, partial [Bacteroidota bacterium]|nr:FkbM family methyltransferase [Bacteroidota bacterium]
MRILFKNLKALLKNLYISFYYVFRQRVKWKKLNSVYLNITDPIISKPLFGNIIFGDYEFDENKILKKTIDKDDVLLELGTGLGYNSISAAKINNNKVVTYEGNPNLIPLIKQNMKKNSVKFRLENKIVLSKNFEDADCEFNIFEDFWSSSLKSNIDGKIVRKVTVKSYDINRVLREVQPSYLIVDIEGGEEDFFEDCSFLQNSSVRKILLELHANIIGEDKCSMVIENILKSGFKIRLDNSPKN